jgi:trehalose/maltose hydrolase-like predicted phosphorylase
VNLWNVEEEAFEPDKLRSLETLYTIGNGYFGTRGAFEEGYPKATPATLLAGVFDKIDIGKEELANAPDWLPIKLFVNSERFRLDEGEILSYRRVLDMRRGVLSREVHWRSPAGIGLHVAIERIASLHDEHVGAIHYSVTLDEDEPATSKPIEVVLSASLNLAVGNHGLMHWEAVEQRHDSEISWLHSQTRKSGIQLVQTMSFSTARCDYDKELIRSDVAPMIRLYGVLAPGETLTAEKVVVMYTSRDVENPLAAALEHHERIMQAAGERVEDGRYYTLHVEGITSEQPCKETRVFANLLADHLQAWQRYWDISDVIIEGDDRAQRAIRYNLYQLRISDPAHDSHYSIAAKGLTGFGYNGHIFHDTEIFMLPYFTFVHPDLARNLLLYRYHLLPAAREKARANGYEGAQFPWESTLDGKEATPDAIVHPESGELIAVINGSIELHITSSVAYAFWHYWDVTGDDEFMHRYGAELLLSTATFWVSRVTYNDARGEYEINDVIGPDEWHEHVNNNAYTNVMARWNISTALDTLVWLQAADAQHAQSLLDMLQLDEQKLQRWHDVITRIHIQQDKQSGLFEQFDGFFQLPHFDQERYRGRKASYQGLLGVQEVGRYQIIKQADVLMLLTVLRQNYDQPTKRVNWDYYYPITDHNYGSSLTPALHVILACELGLTEPAYKLFMKGALVDLEDQRGNSNEGIHDACAGAVWQAAIMGFAGLRLEGDSYTTRSSWPDNWTRLAFKFIHKGQLVEVDLRKE